MSQGSESRREVARSAPSAPKGSTLLAAARTEPHALPESRSTADPGPQGPEAAHHPLPRSSREPHKDTHRRNTCPADTYPLDREAAREGKRRALRCPLVPQVSNNSSMAAAPSTAAGLCPTQAPSDCQGWEEQVPPACPQTHTHTHTPSSSHSLSPPLRSARSASLWLVGSQWDKTLSVISASWVPRASLIIL